MKRNYIRVMALLPGPGAKHRRPHGQPWSQPWRPASLTIVQAPLE